MKRILFILITMLAASCATTKAVKESKGLIKGTWVLNNINYSESGIYKVNLLNDVSADCFTGSTWVFVPNNNTGTYSINGSGCNTGTRYFIFTIVDASAGTSGNQAFILKPTDAKHKSETNQGFRMQLVQLTATSMQIQQSVTVDGKPFTITMNFTKQ